MARGSDFLASRGMGAAVPARLCAGEESPGEDKSQPRHCGTGDRGPCRPSATFKPSEASWFALGRQHEKTGRSIGARGHACQSNEKLSRRSNGRPRIPEPDHTEPARNSSPTPQRAFAVVEWRQWPDIIVLSTISDPLANRLETEPDEPSTWSLTAADQTQNQQQRPARRRTGRRMPNAPMPPPPRSLRLRHPWPVARFRLVQQWTKARRQHDIPQQQPALQIVERSLSGWGTRETS